MSRKTTKKEFMHLRIKDSTQTTVSLRILESLYIQKLKPELNDTNSALILSNKISLPSVAMSLFISIHNTTQNQYFFFCVSFNLFPLFVFNLFPLSLHQFVSQLSNFFNLFGRNFNPVCLFFFYPIYF